MTVRFTCISLCIFFMAGRLHTVRFFRVQASQVVVNWFYPLRKITIPVAIRPRRVVDAGHTSPRFPACWYGVRKGAGSRAGKGGRRQRRPWRGFLAQSACARAAASAVSAFKLRCEQRPAVRQPGYAAAAGIAGRRADLPQHGPRRIRRNRQREGIQAGRKAPRSRTMGNRMFYIENHRQIIDFNTIFSM